MTKILLFISQGNRWAGRCLAWLFLLAQPSRLLLLLALLLGPLGAWAQVTGTKTVGATGADYPTLTAAMTAVNGTGISGSVILVLQSNYVSTSETFPITYTLVPTGGATVTIRPAAGATGLNITGLAASTSVFNINGGKSLVIDGRVGGTGTTPDLTITGANTGGNTIQFTNNANSNTVQYCQVKGVNSSPTGGVVAFTNTASAAGGNSNNTIANNKIGDNGGTLPTNLVYSIGLATAGAGNANNTVSNNELSNFYNAGTSSAAVLLSGTGAGGNTAWTISGNSIYQTATRTATGGSIHYGITIGTGVGYVITGNFIGGNAASAASGTMTYAGAFSNRFVGIQGIFTSGTASSIQGNTIRRISVSSSSGVTSAPGVFAGIYVSAGDASIGTTTGNVIGDASTANTITVSSSTAGGIMYGIHTATSTGAISISNNTVGNIAYTNVTGSFYGIQGGTTTATVTNNTIKALSIVSSGTTAATLYGYYNGASPTAETITGNTIIGLAVVGTSTATLHTVNGIRLNTSSSDVQVVTGNTISGLAVSATGGSGTATGIHFTLGGGTNSNIARNKIYDLSAVGASGFAYGLTIVGGTTYPVNNNLIGDLRTPASTNLLAIAGLNITGSATVNAYYNTIFLNASSSGATFGTSGIYASTSPTLDLRNNIVANTSTAKGTGLTVAYRRSSTTLTSYASTSNNNLFWAGTPSAANLIFNDGTSSDQTLATYKARVTPRDAASVSENPPFLSTTSTDPTFLHINPAVATQVEGGGTPVSGYTTDYDGDARNASTPDIGADEGTFTPNDQTPPAITYTALANTASTASRTLSVTITDPSGIATVAGAPLLYYRVGTSGAFTAVAASTAPASAPYNGTYTFSIPGAAAGSTVQYYVAAQDASSNNNGGTSPTGGSGINPPGTTPPTTFSSYLILNTLSGDYYVMGTATAGSSPAPTKEFATLTAAAAAYNSSSLGGPVRFLLFSNTQGTETYPINFNANGDASTTNTLTIKPYTGVVTTFTNATTTSTFKTTSGSYIIFDGSNTAGGTSRDLTLSHTSATATAAALVWVASTTAAPAVGVQVRSLALQGVANGSANTSAGIMVSNTTYNSATGGSANGIVLANNSVQGTSHGIVVGNDATTPATGLQITNNVLGPATAATATNLNVFGLFVQQATSPSITGNVVQNVVATSGTTPYGMAFPAGVTGATVTQNTITGITTSFTTDAYGLSLGTGFTNALVNRNKIITVASTNSSGYGGIGVDVSTGSATSNLTLRNNFVAGINGYGWSNFTSDAIMGIRLTGAAGGVNLYFNSVNLSGNYAAPNASTYQSAALYVASTVTALDIRNNIFANSLVNTGGTTSKAYAFYSAAPKTAYTFINYNDYFVSGSQGVLGNLGGSASSVSATGDMTTLAAFRATTGTGQDANSLSIDPAFTSATDLHTVNVSLAVGQPISGVTVDIDGTTRSTTAPYIGAAEGPAPTVMIVTGITYTQNNTPVVTGSTSQQVTGLNVATVNTLSPLSLSSITFDLGSTNPADIANARLYTTTGSTFVLASATLLPGTGTIAATYTLTTPYTLSQGNNYFWLTYDVPTNATPGNTVSSTVAANGVSISGSTYSATLSGPAGSRLIVGPLNGTYTVGQSNATYPAPNYASITVALADLTFRGVSGPVTFALINPTATPYNAANGETFPLALNAYVGSSTTNTVTVKPAAGVQPLVVNAGTNSTFKATSAANYVLDGSNTAGGTSRDLTVNNTSATATAAALVWVASTTAAPVTNVQVLNLALQGAANGSANTSAGVMVSGTTYNSSTGGSANGIVVRNNAIQGVSFGIVVGNDATTPGTGLQVVNNVAGPATAATAANLSVYGIFANYVTAPTITGNTVQNLTSTTLTNYGIYTSNATTPTITGNTVQSVAYSAGAAYGINAVAGTTGGTISNNTISGVSGTGATAATFYALGIATSATSGTVANNTLSNITTNNAGIAVGIYVRAATTGVTMSGNTLSNITAPGTTTANNAYGLYVVAGSSSSTGNSISSLSAANGPAVGIYLGSTSGGTTGAGTTVSRNRIFGLTSTATNGNSGLGIWVATQSGAGVNAYVTLSNNFVGDLHGTGYTGGVLRALSGILLDGNTTAQSGISLYYNSVSLSGSYANVTASAVTAALAISANNAGLDVRDNIFANALLSSTATAGKSYALYVAGATLPFTTSNYNDYYVSGAQGVLAYLKAADVTTLAALQSASTGTGQDANSLSIDPQFTSATDLHAASAALVAGTPIAGTTTDIDGDARNATRPVIGADEFAPSAQDVGISALTAPAATNCYCGSQPVTVTISNYGATATTQPVSVSVVVTFPNNSLATITGTYSGPAIAAGGTASFTVGNYTVSGSGQYLFDATTYPNDSNPANNALIQQTVAVTVPDAIVLTALPTGAVCPNSPMTLTASSTTAYDYTWTSTTGGNLQSTPAGASVTANPGQTATYTATGTTPTGCLTTQTITITVTPAPVLTVTPTTSTICNGSSQTLTASATATAATVLPTATFDSGPDGYTVTIGTTGTANTSGREFTRVTAPYTDPTASLPANYNGPSAAATGGFFIANSNLSGNTSNSVLTSPAFSTVGYLALTLNFQQYYRSSGSAKVEYSLDGTTWTTVTTYTTTQNGNSGAQPVTALALPAAASNQPAVQVRFNYLATNGWYWAIDNVGVTGTPISYNWTLVSGDGLPTVTNTAAILVTPTQNSVYRVTATNTSTTCTSTTTATVNVNSPLAPATNSPVTRCGTGTVALTATPSPAGATINWYATNVSTTVLATTNTYSPTVSASSTYYVASVVGSCVSTRTPVTVTVTTPPTLAGTPAAPAAICQGSSTTVSYSGYANLTVSPNAGATVSGQTITYNPTTTTAYTITGNDGTGASGCSATTTTTITVNPTPNAPTLTPGTQAAYCAGGSTVVAASSNAGTVAATALATADFNSGANGFTTTNTGLAVTGFQRVTAPFSGVRVSVPTSYNGPSGVGIGSFFIADSDDGGSGSATNTTLVSPSFNTLNYTAATLSVQQYYNSYTSDTFAGIEYSTNGTTWTALATYTGSDVGTSGTSTATTLALPAAALNQSNVQIRFRYVSIFGNYWAIDNVGVTGTKSETPTFAVVGNPATASVSGANITFNPTTTTTYNVTASYANGCPSPATPITITVNPLPTATLTNSGPVCAGSTATVSFALTGTGPWSYTYTNGTTSVSGSTATSPLTIMTGVLTASTTYSLTALSDANCTATGPVVATTTVTVNTLATWTGAVSSDWFDGGNWNNGCVPTRSIDASIPAGVASGNYPALTTTATAEVRTLTIAGTLNQSAGVLNVYGNLSTSAATSLTGGMIALLGTSPTVTGPSPFYHLDVNLSQTSGTGALSSATSITNRLTMTQGVLNTNSYTLTLLTGSTLSETDDSYLLGTVSVPDRTLTAGTAESFSGIGLVLTPAVGSTSPGATPVVRTTGTALTGVGTSVSIKRYFDIKPAVNTGLNVDMDLSYLNHELNAIPSANLALFKSVTTTSGPWANQSPITVAGNTISKTGIADFSIWTLGNSAAPLPVELTRFEATRAGSDASLTWTTASEKNSRGFEVQVSTDGRSYRALSFVASPTAASTAPHEYAYLDREAGKAGLRYYRLRQLDLDGTATFSPVRTLRFEGKEARSFTAAPNPFHDRLTLTVELPAGLVAAPAQLSLTDAAGRTLLTQRTPVLPAGLSQLELPDLAKLASGVYIVHLAVPGQPIQHLKVVKE